MQEFTAFRIQERDFEYENIISSRRLFQQFVVDCFTMIESQKFLLIRLNQKFIRSNILSGLQLTRTDSPRRNRSFHCWKTCNITIAFYEGKRYKFNNFRDAMAICKRLEIGTFLSLLLHVTQIGMKYENSYPSKELTAADRPNIIC